MKQRMKRFAALAMTAMAAVAGVLTSCDEGTEPVVPVVSIETQPTAPSGAFVEGAIPVNTNLTVAATASNGATPTYQWYANTEPNNTGGTKINGATAASYTLPADLAEGIHHYFCEVGVKGAKAVRTNAVTVTVSARPVIAITTEPVAPPTLTADAIPANTSLTVAATASNGATLSYQWYIYDHENNELFEAIGGATSAAYTLPTTLTAGDHWYVCNISATGCNDAQTDPVKVTVNPAVPTINITSHPASPAAMTEGSVMGVLTVAASATGGASISSYQWYSNTMASNDGGTAISGAISSSFTIPTGLTEGQYHYFCEVGATGDATAKRSNVATVTVNAAVPVYRIVATPALLLFGSMQAGYTPPAAQTVTVRNTGNRTVTLGQPASDYYDVGTLTKTTLAPNETATFTVRPKAGLTLLSSYNDYIGIYGSDDVSTHIEARFTVTTAPPTGNQVDFGGEGEEENW